MRRAIAGACGALGCGLIMLLAAGCAASSPDAQPTANTNAAPPADGIDRGEPLPPGTVVQLRFRWPVGLTGRYESKWQQEGSSPSAGTVRGRMSVREAADGLLIADDIESVEGTGIVRRLASMSPNYVVSPEGEFLRIVGISEHQRKVQSMVDELLANADQKGNAEARAKAMEMVGPLLTKEALTAEVANGWAMGVGFWAGADLEAGETFTFTDTSHTLLEPRQEIEMQVSFGIRGGSSCKRGGEERSCVVLELEQKPTERGREQAVAAVKAVVKKALDEADQHVEAMKIEFDQTFRVVLHAEPATLIPHRMHIANERQFQVTTETQNESRDETSRVDVEFRYP